MAELYNFALTLIGYMMLFVVMPADSPILRLFRTHFDRLWYFKCILTTYQGPSKRNSDRFYVNTGFIPDHEIKRRASFGVEGVSGVSSTMFVFWG